MPQGLVASTHPGALVRLIKQEESSIEINTQFHSQKPETPKFHIGHACCGLTRPQILSQAPILSNSLCPLHLVLAGRTGAARGTIPREEIDDRPVTERHVLLSRLEELHEAFRRTRAVFSNAAAVRGQLSVPCSIFTETYGAFVTPDWGW